MGAEVTEGTRDRTRGRRRTGVVRGPPQPGFPGATALVQPLSDFPTEALIAAERTSPPPSTFWMAFRTSRAYHSDFSQDSFPWEKTQQQTGRRNSFFVTPPLTLFVLYVFLEHCKPCSRAAPVLNFFFCITHGASIALSALRNVKFFYLLLNNLHITSLNCLWHAKKVP